MKTNKKLFSVLLTVIVMLGMLTGCGSETSVETIENIGTTETSAIAGTEAIETTMEAEETTEPAAETEPVEYKIVYETNGGILDGEYTATYTEESPVILPVPTKTAHVFKGWYEEEDFSGESVTSTEGATGDKIYYAKWELKINSPSVNKEEENSDPVDRHDHSYTSTVVKPTCTAKGYTLHECKCGVSFKDTETAAIGHNYQSKVVAPTTEAQGYTLHTCKNCGDSYKDSFTDKLHKHSYTNTVVKPTCTTKGYTLHECKCGVSFKDTETAAIGHNYQSKVVAPTTEAQGYTVHTCKNCGDSYKDSFTDKLHKHSYTSTVVKPTCTAKGYTLHECKCGVSFKDTETAAIGHNYQSKVVAPTTEAQGYTEHTCKNCGDSYKDSYTDKLPTQPEPGDGEHTHSYTSTVTKPTCDTNGYTTYKCSCGHSYTGDETLATGHLYTAVVVAPTITSEGYTERTCNNCGHSYKSDFTEKLPEVITPPDHTCVWFDLGYISFCEICGATKEG